MEEKIIRKIDFAILVGSAIMLVFIVRYATPLVVAPVDNTTTANTRILFSFEKANIIYIDDNINFTSPEKIFAENNLVINLKPGVYYWKIEGIMKSEVRKLTIASEVNLKMRKAGELYEVINAGNVKLNVDIYNESVLAGKVVLDVDESRDVSGTKFIGGQNE